MKEDTNERMEPNSALSRAGKGSVFELPPLYFESLSERVEEKIKGLDAVYDELLPEVETRETPDLEDINVSEAEGASYGPMFSGGIGDDYFEGLNQRIFARIEKEEEEAGLDLLSVSGLNSNPFTVPDRYFEESEERILNQFKKPEKKPAVLIAIWNRPFTRIAVAASFTLLLVFSGLKVKNIQDMKKEYANVPVDDKFYYSYDTDESLVEDELVSDQDSSADSVKNDKTDASKSSSSDTYLLEHKDEHTLVEEI